MFRRAAKQLVQPIRQHSAQLSEQLPFQQLGQRGHASRFGNAYRQLFTSAESSQGGAGSQKGPPKSMLDAGVEWQQAGASGTALGNAAAARMRAVAAAEGAEGAGNAGAGAAAAGAGTSFGESAWNLAKSILGPIFDITLYTGLIVAVAGGTVYATYSIQEVEEALDNAEQQLQKEPSIVTQAWVQLLQTYLTAVTSMEHKVRVCGSECCDQPLTMHGMQVQNYNTMHMHDDCNRGP